MSAWQPIETAPTDTPILAWGKLADPAPEHSPPGPMRAVIYWDEIDDAWALTTTTWEGPFFDPTHWQPIPAPPSPA